MITIAHNPTTAKIVNAPREALLEVHRLLSYSVEGSEHMPSFKSGDWNGKSSFFSWDKRTFPTGFVRMIVQGLRKLGYTVQVMAKPAPEPLGPELPVVDEFGYIERYDYQPQAVEQLVRHKNITVQVATGGGKCLGKDTPVLMYDGSVKMVQDVQTGDLLMGPDSTPRTVLSTCKGYSELYRVTPVKGDPYVVNDAHILSLKKTSRGYRGKNRGGAKYPKGEVVNINVQEYLAETNTFRHIHKGWRTGVDFAPREKMVVDPYLLGIILGDGTINGTVSVTTGDQEIVDMLNEQATAWGIKTNVISKEGNRASAVYLTSGRTGGIENPLMGALRSLGFVSEGRKAVKKFIPHCYKTASRQERMELLAGLLDSDGYYDGKCLYLTLKEEQLFDGALFLVRSLGLAAYKSTLQKKCCNNGVVGTYFCMTIVGDIDQIPVRLERRKPKPRQQKKDHLVTGLSIKSIGMGDYYGFEIDGDHLFVLGDFTVTHNTRIARMAMKRIDRPALFLTTRGILMHQMHQAIEKMEGKPCAILGDGEWGIPYTKPDGTPGRKLSKFTVGMVQTLAQRLEIKTVDAEMKALQARRANEVSKKIEAERTKLKKAKVPIVQIGERLLAHASELEKSYPSAAEDKAKITTKVEKHERLRLATIDILAKFELVIVEEAHEVSSDSFYIVMAACRNAHYRMALTGTPFMKDDEEANMRLLASCGPVAIKITEKMLIDRGILARPYFKYINLPEAHKPKALYRSTPWQKAYEVGIVGNEYRNKAFCAEILRARSYGLNSMVLVQHKAHGELLKGMLQRAGLKVEFIYGEDNQSARSAALTALGNGGLDVLIGSTILDVGVDVPSVGMIVLAGGGKAEVATRQRIGRGLREKKGGGPNVAFIVDAADDHNNHIKGHYLQRRGIVKSTPGFAENVVDDFDFKALGFERTRSAA